MSGIVDILAGTTTGGVLGLAGSVISKGASYITDKQKAKDEREGKALDYQHALELAKIAHEQGMQQGLQEFDKIEMEKRYEGMLASIADQTAIAQRTSQWVTDVLALVRPGLTGLLIVIAFMVAIMVCLGATQTLLNPFYQFSAMASMAVAWWFGDKATQARDPRNPR